MLICGSIIPRKSNSRSNELTKHTSRQRRYSVRWWSVPSCSIGDCNGVHILYNADEIVGQSGELLQTANLFLCGL